METLPSIHAIISRAEIRCDRWGGEKVLLLVQAEHDLVAAEARYHRECATRFWTQKKVDEKQPRGRPKDQHMLKAFENLCRFIEDNEECQYAMQDLLAKMESFLGDAGQGGSCSAQYLKLLVKKHYEDRVIITSLRGPSENVVTFCDTCDRVLKESWMRSSEMDSELEKDRIVSMAAAIFRIS